jgi:DNA-binding transcriptional MerR regulator
MPEVTDSSYLSIGEVLGLLLEEFPDVTISKIRFLESQGLISPERTASGYRKFYSDDVELLRVILTEQRQNYLPLRVIKDRLDAGEIDPTGEHLKPGVNGHSGGNSTPGVPDDDDHDEPSEVPTQSLASHPTARRQPPVAAPEIPATHASSSASSPSQPAGATIASIEPQLLPGVLLDRGELCGMVGMTDAELTELESFGIVSSRDSGGVALYGDDAVSIARPACEFLRLGVDARHLRNWRTSAEREASLYEQLVTPRFRQRNPESRAEALTQLRRLDALGGSLRAAMMRQALRHHFES